MKIFRRVRLLVLLVVPLILGAAMWVAAQQRDQRLATHQLLERLKSYGEPEQRIRIDDLLSRGADAKVADEAGRTLLHLAISRGDADYLVAPLLNGGANVNARMNDGLSPRVTPLFLATQMGKDEVVRLLLARGAKVQLDIAPPGQSGTALTWLEWDIQNPQLQFGRQAKPHQYRAILGLLRTAALRETGTI